MVWSLAANLEFVVARRKTNADCDLPLFDQSNYEFSRAAITFQVLPLPWQVSPKKHKCLSLYSIEEAIIQLLALPLPCAPPKIRVDFPEV